MDIKKITQKIEKDLAPIFPEDIDFTHYNLRDNFLQDIFSLSWITGYRTGASKLVLLTKGDFVIKIPFVGITDDDYPEETSYFFMAYSATDGQTSEWDYCEAEDFIYKEAKKSHLENFFAPTIKVTEIAGHPIYIQKKVTSFIEKCESEGSIDTLGKTGKAVYYNNTNKIMHKYSGKHNHYSFIDTPVAWLTDMRKKCGNQVFVKLINFIEKLGIEDLHSDNIGYINDQPVFFDYSSFAD